MIRNDTYGTDVGLPFITVDLLCDYITVFEAA